MIKPAYLKMFDKDEWKALKEDATGPGGVDRLRRTIEEHDWFAPFMNKGGAVKKKKMAMGGMMPTEERKINPTTGLTMKKGGMTDMRKTGKFYGGMARKK